MSIYEPAPPVWTSRMLAVLRILSGEMAVAYWQFHAPQSPFPSVNLGTPAILYCFLYLYLAFAGAGAWSLDGLFARRAALRST